MAITHRSHVAALLRQAPPADANLVAQLPADLQMSLPVDAERVTQAIDDLATAAGLVAEERRELMRARASADS